MIRIVEGNQTPDFEELNILTPGLTWSPDGNKIALSAKRNGFDVIYIFDLEAGDRETLDINRLRQLKVSAGQMMVKSWRYIGQNAQQSDVYVYNFETAEIVNLTNDIFSDSDPSWSHDDSSIYFVSDRGYNLNGKNLEEDFKIAKHNYSQKDIYKINLPDTEIIQHNRFSI